MQEARRLANSEEDRRRTTEGKASTYLLFAAAFAAALIPFLPGILEGKTGSAPRWLIAIILIVAALYLMAAGTGHSAALVSGRIIDWMWPSWRKYGGTRFPLAP